MMNLFLWLIMVCWEPVLSAELRSSPNQLNGKHLRTVWPLWKGNPKGLTGPLKGGVFIDYLSARFNFTYEMVKVTVNGKALLSFLLENKCDFVLDGYLALNERIKVVDMTHPWSFDFFAALIPAPEVGANTNAVIKPFQWQVWLSLGISIVIVIFVLNHVYRPLESYFLPKTPIADSQPETSSSSNYGENPVADQFFYVFGNLLSQGGPCKFKRLTFRLVAGCWTLAAFVLVQAYTSTLLTYVMVPVSTPLIKTVYDIPDTADIKLLVRKTGGLNLIFSNSSQSTEIFKKLLERLNSFPDSRCDNISDCIDSIKPGSRNVFSEGRPYLLDIIKERYEKTGKCDLQLAKEGILNYMTHFALQKNSPYTSSINQGILEMHQMGLVDYWDTWFRPMPPQCNIQGENRNKLAKTENDLSRLSLKNLTGAFVILAVGYSISSFVFVIELLMALVSKRCRKKLPERHHSMDQPS